MMKEKKDCSERKSIHLPRMGLKRLFGAAVTGLVMFITPPAAEAAGLLVADGGFGGRLEIIEHEVRVVVNNSVAVTEVTQVFRNTENRQVEALYTFPVPESASVANFSMWINGKEMVGEVVEKKRARKIYNSYKRKRRDPGLLEQNDYKTFEMRVFPVAPRAEQRVQITYYQELDFDQDWATWVYPLATSTQKDVDTRVQGRFAASLEVRSAVPIVAMESPSHPRDFEIVRHTDNYYEASLERRDGDLGRDVVLAFRASRPITGFDLITSREKGGDGFFSLGLTAGEDLAKVETGSDYVFILDVSGSMANGRKLTTSRSSIEAFVEALGPEDRFEVITFNSQPRPLFRSLTQAEEAARERAVAFLGSREARGGTRLQPALGTAYRYRDPDRFLNIVILSDGLTEQAERRSLVESIRSRPANVRVFCVGVGNEINRPLLKQIAEDAGGMAAFISQGDNFSRQARSFRRKLTHPVASDLRIDISGVEVFDVDPERLPNLYHGLPVRLYGRYRGDGEAEVRIRAIVNGREIEQKATLDFPDVDAGNPEIERVWAWHRIQTLQKEIDMTGSQEAAGEIVRLGEAFSIVSKYTSFLVLENDAEYRRWKIDRRNALRLRRDRAAQEETRNRLRQLRDQALNELGPIDADTVQAASAPPVAKRRASSSPQTPTTESRPHRRKIDLPSLGGGGAVDPLGALLAMILGGSALCGARRRK